MDLDGIDNALKPTRVARLALDALLGSLPEDMLTPATENTLWDVHDQLCEKELADLRRWGSVGSIDRQLSGFVGAVSAAVAFGPQRRNRTVLVATVSR